jgi:putative oxidoreductase
MFLKNTDLGALLLRLVLGGMILFHGLAKMITGVGGIEVAIEQWGLPGVLAYAVFIGEVIAPAMVILGYRTSLFALLIAVNMMVAIALVHVDDIFMLGSSGGWSLELQGLFLGTALAVMLIGPGRYKMKN